MSGEHIVVILQIVIFTVFTVIYFVNDVRSDP